MGTAVGLKTYSRRARERGQSAEAEGKRENESLRTFEVFEPVMSADV